MELISAYEARAFNPDYIEAKKRLEKLIKLVNSDILERSSHGYRDAKIFFKNHTETEEMKIRLEDKGFICRIIEEEDIVGHTSYGLKINW